MAEQTKFKQLLASCFEKYEEIRKLISKKDPENEPYKSKYEAKEVLSLLKKELINYEDDIISRMSEKASESEIVLRLRAISAAVNYNFGVVSIETEEFSSGEEHLTKCLEILEGRELSRDCILLVLQALNQIGILWSLRGEPQKAVDYLGKVEVLSKKYRNEVCLAPFDIEDLFTWHELDDEQIALALEKNWKKLEKTLTHALYYLAQVYSNLNETVRAANYCHTTLRRQLESQEYDPVDWAINSATLSQFFIAQHDFADARHHLVCASYVLDNYESELRGQESKPEDYDTLLDTVQHRRADLARCWAKYGLLLLSVSWDELMRQVVEEIVDDVNSVKISDEKSDMTDNSGADGAVNTSNRSDDQQIEDRLLLPNAVSEKPRLIFKSLEVTTLEEQISTKLVLDFDQARLVFLNAQKWINLAKDFYTLTDHASDHIQLVQDTSKLYKLLAYFESNDERRCKMHKRRIDALEGVLKELNPQYYLNAVRQLQFELAETYSEIMDTKLMLRQNSVAPRSQHLARKVNLLAEGSMTYFRAFIDTFLDTNKKMPETFPEELVRPALLAHFCIGRLHAKLINEDPEAQIANLQNSLLMYKFVVDYCEKYPSATELVKDELEVTKEMVQLLPMKIEKIAILACY